MNNPKGCHKCCCRTIIMRCINRYDIIKTRFKCHGLNLYSKGFQYAFTLGNCVTHEKDKWNSKEFKLKILVYLLLYLPYSKMIPHFGLAYYRKYIQFYIIVPICIMRFVVQRGLFLFSLNEQRIHQIFILLHLILTINVIISCIFYTAHFHPYPRLGEVCIKKCCYNLVTT